MDFNAIIVKLMILTVSPANDSYYIKFPQMVQNYIFSHPMTTRIVLTPHFHLCMVMVQIHSFHLESLQYPVCCKTPTLCGIFIQNVPWMH